MASPGDDTSFLPDFCDIRMVFAVVLAGELLALVLALVSLGRADAAWWHQLGLVSVFVQWVGLSSAAVLCVARRWLRHIDDIQAGIASYALVLLVCAALTELAYWLIANRLVLLDSADLAAILGERTPVVLGHAEFVRRNLAIAAIVVAVMLRYLYVQHQWKRRIESEARARIQALQSRIRPHFLFNSMNTIASLTRSRPEVAEQVTEDLAELFRESLGDASVPTTLARELETCRQYLRIEEQRLGERLSTHWAVDGLPGHALLPRLTLQPLVENAVYHGVEPADSGGCVEIGGELRGETVSIVISNPLPVNAGVAPRKGNRIAQGNVAERLVAFFGPGAKVTVESSDVSYRVALEFPMTTEPR